MVVTPPLSRLVSEHAEALMAGGDQIQRYFEAHVGNEFTGLVGGLLHRNPHEIVGDDHHLKGFVRHVRRPHREELHAQGGFHIAEFEFDLPTPGVEIG